MVPAFHKICSLTYSPASLQKSSAISGPRHVHGLPQSLPTCTDEEGHLRVRLSSMDTDGALLHQIAVPIVGQVLEIVSCAELYCWVSMTSDFHSSKITGVHVCNPSTKDYLMLAPSPNFKIDIYGLGFGHLPSMNEYKIVHLFKIKTNRHCYVTKIGCEVLTVTHCAQNAEAEWRLVGDCPFVGQRLHCTVFVNGSIYWLILDERWDRKEILKFHLETEEFGLLLFPFYTHPAYFREVKLLNFEGTLCLADRNGSGINLWILKDEENQIWVKGYTIDISHQFWVQELALGAISRTHHLEMVDYIRSARHGGELLIKSSEGGCLYFNLEMQSIRVTENLDIEKENLPSVYFDSFFSLGSR